MRRMPRLLFMAIAASMLLAQVVASPGTPASGARRNRAGVVVVHADERVETDCVRFRENVINGLQLLNRSRFESMAAKFSFGKQICYLDGEGCATTDPDRCTDCQPPDGFDGVFWGYFVQDKTDDEPGFADTGAGDRKVRRGSIDYWVFGDGSVMPDEQSIGEICRKA